MAATVPPKIRVPSSAVSNDSIPAFSESELHQRARALAKANKSMKSYIGMGYHNAVVPPVILRNVSCATIFRMSFVFDESNKVMESPAWYTPYTPYQPEIAQGATCLFERHNMKQPIECMFFPQAVWSLW